VAARPGWNTLSAVKQGRVFILDDDIASRWRPRIVDLAHAVAEAVTKASK
jgi:iron complex transport system substrate-binding protein